MNEDNKEPSYLNIEGFNKEISNPFLSTLQYINLNDQNKLYTSIFEELKENKINISILNNEINNDNLWEIYFYYLHYLNY